MSQSTRMSDRAIAACRDYDYWAAHIKLLTERIGDELGQCNRGWSEKGRTHVSEAFSVTHVEANSHHYEDSHRFRTETEQNEIVSGCDHCRHALTAIRQRIAARKCWGVAKREIRSVARAATRQS